jgi:hypothetical protein
MWTQMQEISTFQVTWQTQKTEEGKGQQAKEEYMPPLQEVPLQQEPSSSRTGQMHVEQEIQGIQGLPLQIDL